MPGCTIGSAVSGRNISTRSASNQKIYSAVKRLFSATRNSFRGLADGIRTEAAVREEAVLFVVALPVGAFIAPTFGWYLAMIASLLVLLAVEFLNTAIEKLSDHVTPEQHHLSLIHISEPTRP